MAMGPQRPTFMQDPQAYERQGHPYSIIPPKQENADTPRTIPFQAQLAMHEQVAITLGILQAENAATQASVQAMVKKVEDFINPPQVLESIYVPANAGVAGSGIPIISKTWQFGPERWILERVTMMRRNGLPYPSSIQVTDLMVDSTEYLTLDSALPSFEDGSIGYGPRMVTIQNNDAANACMVKFKWRRLWSFERGHE